MNAQERKARDRIIEAAMDLFGAKGFNSTSIADILSRTQLNCGSLYHFFPGKQDVLVARARAYRDGIYQMLIDPAWQGVDDPIERIFALLAATAADRRDRLHLRLPDRQPRAGAARARPARCASCWRTTSPAGPAPSRRCLDDARRAPARAISTAAALAEFVLTTMEGGVMQARTHRDVAYFDRGVAMLRDHFDMLLRRRAARERGRRLERRGIQHAGQ